MKSTEQPNLHAANDQAIVLSFVVPVFNETAVFADLVARLQATMQQADFRCEVVIVDDGSTDGTRELINDICARDNRFQGVLLSRNFGHQAAVSAGLDHAQGQAVGVIDGDLQDPPELLLDFHARLNEGYDVVYAVRQRRKEGPLKKFCYWAFYRMLRSLSVIEIPLDSGDFCIMSRSVVDQIRMMPERHRFIRGMRTWVGYRQTGFEYERSARHAGESKYTLPKLMQLALDGIFTFSEKPLRLATYCGITVAMMAMFWGVYILGWRLFAPETEVPGFATLSCGMFFLGGVQLICLGILGEYVARIHNEVKRRPVYIVESLLGTKETPQVLEDEERKIASELKEIGNLMPTLTTGVSNQQPLGNNQNC